ncbi:iron ABC transporter permease, partial [Mesorhizobium sp.]|uniref:iron ABC transporter permease n=4 Tax=unclassified Mesorhizobium TaxID=325217 RepID=UPI0025C029EF
MHEQKILEVRRTRPDRHDAFPGLRHPAFALAMLVGAAAIAALALLSIAYGSTLIPLTDVVAALGRAIGFSGHDVSGPVGKIVVDLRLPRTVLAICVGAGLGVVGALLQTVTRNDLADPFLFGLSSGAAAGAVSVITVFGDSFGIWTLPVAAFTGGILAAGVVLLLVARVRGQGPERLILAGLAVSFMSTALTNYLVFAGDQRAAHSVLFWTMGGLGLARWDNIWLGALGAGTILAYALWNHRRLDAFLAGENAAESLGVPVARMRRMTFLVAAFSTAILVSVAGVIGFVGLAAATLARIGGARRLGQQLVMAPLIGGALLWAADQAVQIATGPQGDLLPTGAITALLGAPLLLWLLPRLALGSEAPTLMAARLPRASRPGLMLTAIGLALLLLLGLALLYGPGPHGWTFAFGDELQPLLSWRWPRVLAALSAGAMLALAGLMMQRLTGNPMASPEVLGISAGAALGMMVALFALSDAGRPVQTAAATIGAFAALLVTLAIGRRAAYAPERLLLAGVALTALFDALILVLTATGDPRAMLLLNWLTGSTYGVDVGDALLTGGIAVCLFALAPFFMRWLDIL